MGREWFYDDRLRKRDIERYKALRKTPEQEAEFNEWLETLNVSREVVEEYEQKVEEEERKQRWELRTLFKELFDVLPFEQYDVLYMLSVREMTRKEIMEETGKSPVALRGNIYDAKQTIIRKGLWDKFRMLFD